MNLKSTTSSITDFFTSKSKFRYYLPQILTLVGIIFIFGYFSYNAQVNMDNRGITFGYGFLSQESSFDVQFSLIEYDGSHSYFRAYLVGLLNTILVFIFINNFIISIFNFFLIVIFLIRFCCFRIILSCAFLCFRIHLFRYCFPSII